MPLDPREPCDDSGPTRDPSCPPSDGEPRPGAGKGQETRAQVGPRPGEDRWEDSGEGPEAASDERRDEDQDEDRRAQDEDQDEEDVLVVRPLAPRSVVMLCAALAFLVLIGVVALVPVPYAISAPGPTRDTLGSHDGHTLITVEGHATYPTTGELLLTTVSVYGRPQGTSGLDGSVSLLDVLRAALDDADAVRPADVVFPPGQTTAERDREGAVQLTSSQENATVAALTELGIEVPAVLTVAWVDPDKGAAGLLEDGDVLESLDGTPVTTWQDLTGALERRRPGEEVKVGVRRDGKDIDVPVVAGDDGEGNARLGVGMDPTFDYPFQVEFDIEGIGGPSAGTMFALGIVDKLTPQDMTGGVTVAGTGTMALDGTVGEIGGIVQKLAGARRDGAEWFLVPAGNCSQTAGHVPEGLRLVRISTLHEAREAVDAIGRGKGADLPTCD